MILGLIPLYYFCTWQCPPGFHRPWFRAFRAPHSTREVDKGNNQTPWETLQHEKERLSQTTMSGTRQRGRQEGDLAEAKPDSP